ncbi:MAG: hypothetical protein M1813_005187 [Trichoglossum hirsutum]|nr:MAG: hypothetical protein M1813_005187 [Trichoglossum hirsutum]
MTDHGHPAQIASWVPVLVLTIAMAILGFLQHRYNIVSARQGAAAVAAIIAAINAVIAAVEREPPLLPVARTPTPAATGPSAANPLFAALSVMAEAINAVMAALPGVVVPLPLTAVEDLSSELPPPAGPPSSPPPAAVDMSRVAVPLPAGLSPLTAAEEPSSEPPPPSTLPPPPPPATAVVSVATALLPLSLTAAEDPSEPPPTAVFVSPPAAAVTAIKALLEESIRVFASEEQRNSGPARPPLAETFPSSHPPPIGRSSSLSLPTALPEETGSVRRRVT